MNERLLCVLSNQMDKPLDLPTTGTKGIYRRPEMDGLRGIACLIVLVFHCLGITTPDIWGVYDYSTGIPKIGVWLFFSLSAFLLTVQLLNKGLSTHAVAQYFLDRALRILPPFFIAVALYDALGIIPLTAWHNLENPAAVAHLWTIPAELVFYAFLPPLLFATIISEKRFGVQFGIGTCTLLIAVAIAIWPPMHTPENSMWFGWYAVNFGSGVLAGIAAQYNRHPRRPMLAWIAVLLIILLIIGAKIGAFGDAKNWLVDKHYIFGPLWSVVICVAYTTAPKLLRARPLSFIGRCSYSIYLFHWAVAALVVHWFPAQIAFPVSLVAAILIGWLGYILLERPTYWIRTWLLRKIPAQRFA